MMKSAIIYDKWLSGLGGGEVVACSMAAILRDSGYDVTLVSQDAVSPEEIKSKLGIDITGITLQTIQNEILLKSVIRNPQLFINLSFMSYPYGFAKRNIYYVHFPSQIRSGFFNIVLKFFQDTNLQSLFPNLLREKINDRLRAGIFPDMKKRLDSYDTFITHSKYVAAWTKKNWGKEARVLYPPVSLLLTNDQQLTTKKNWICSVGRFFTLAHSKKQEVMIEAFKKLISNNQYPITSDLQLHLVGGVGNEPSSLRFIEDLRAEAKGYPIYFHYNVDRREVEDILLKSKIYWHAAGFGEDPQKDPIKFEHFGIAPIEAISAGCIPILFNGGGLTEIVDILELSRNKHLFASIEELVDKTKLLMNETLPSSTQDKAIKSFFKEHFTYEFLKLIAS